MSVLEIGRRVFLTTLGKALLLGATGITPPAQTPLPIPTDGAIVTTFGLSNWGTSISKGFFRQGIVFRDGDVPAGSSVQVQYGGNPIAVQFNERRSFPSGCLSLAVMHGRDADFPAGASRSYMVRLALGVPFNDSSSTTPAALAAERTLSVTLTNHRTVNDVQRAAAGPNSNPSDPVTTSVAAGTATAVASGTSTAAFADHMAVATRREMHHTGAVCDGGTCWGMVKHSDGALDAHLKIAWHVDRWKNADGSTYAIEAGAEPQLSWWSVPNKVRHDYDLTFKDGGTTIATYNAVQHMYNSHWLTVQNAGGNNRGRRHWIGGACPTLTYQPDRAYWIASGYVPPVNLATARNPWASPGEYSGNATYIPISNQEHRPSIDGTGGYMGRGVMPNCDFFAFQSQSASDVAAARVNSMAGLHVFLHHRSNRQRIRPGDSAADTANTVVAWDMRGPAGLPPFDFTAQGMPVPVLAGADSRNDPANMDGYVRPAGGRVYFDTSYGDGTSDGNSRGDDASHAVNYCYFMYLLEGERCHMEATCDLAQATLHQRTIDGYCPTIPWDNDGGPRWGGVAQVNTDEERSTAFAQNLIGSAATIIPDTHVASKYFQRLLHQQGLYMQALLDGAPPDMLLAGVHPWTDATGGISPFQLAFNALACYRTWHLTGEPGVKAWADQMARWSINHFRDRTYQLEGYHIVSKRYQAPHDFRLNVYPPLSLDVDTPTVTIAAATGLLTVIGGYAIADGCIYYVAKYNYGGASTVCPTELSYNTPYYMRDVTSQNGNQNGTTFRLSLARGGPAIIFGKDYLIVYDANGRVTSDTSVHFLRDVDPGLLNPDLPYSYIGSDDYALMHAAALVEAYRTKHPMVTGALVQRAQHYLSGITAGDLATCATWDYAIPANEWGGAAAAATPPSAVTNLRTTFLAADLVWIGWDMPAGKGQQPTFKVENSGDGGQTWAVATASTPLLGCGISNLISAPRSQIVRVTPSNEAGAGPAATLAVTLKASAGNGPGPYTYTIKGDITSTGTYVAQAPLANTGVTIHKADGVSLPGDGVYFRWSTSATDPLQNGAGPGAQVSKYFGGSNDIYYLGGMLTPPAGTWYLWVTIDGEGCAKQCGAYTFT